MPTDTVSYVQSGMFSQIILDYLEGNEALKEFYHRSPDPENFRLQIEEKSVNFNVDRNLLADELLRQSVGNISKVVQHNIDLLRKPNTFTITTGHQLTLFTGPLYFIYKIVQAIKMCHELKKAYPNFDFVPVYWMASEDHDFAEINHFNYRGNRISWPQSAGGAVGRLPLGGMDDVFAEFDKLMGRSDAADQLRDLFKTAYLTSRTLAEATRKLVNHLFADLGLIVIDGDSVVLKQLFSSYIKEELLTQVANEAVRETIDNWKYSPQVAPREINLFYLGDGFRERIILQDNHYFVNNTDLRFTEAEILKELQNYPERFSPNVILRPLYQEVILPNLCYIGGGGEIAYWLELKELFGRQNVTFPLLMLRNSVLLVSAKQSQKADRLGLNWADLFMPKEQLVQKTTRRLSSVPLDFTALKQQLSAQFSHLKVLAQQTHPSFLSALAAQEQKQLKGLLNLEKKLLRAERIRLSDQIRQVTLLKEELFPGGLQERYANFAAFYETDDKLISTLLEKLNPWSKSFTIITI